MSIFQTQISQFFQTVRTVYTGCTRNCRRSRIDDSQLPWDSGGAYGGWGGYTMPDTREAGKQPPIVFLHGNRRDACDWLKHKKYFSESGVSKQNLWAITFRQKTPSHDQMASQIDDFVNQILYHTNAPKVTIVAHSLGVTGARYWLDQYDAYDKVDTFVSIGGANHGLSLCTPFARARTTRKWLQPCSFLRGDYARFDDHPLTKLNTGSETPGDVTYYTLRGEDDRLFRDCPESPRLEGAKENRVLETAHDGTRESPEAIKSIYDWVVE